MAFSTAHTDFTLSPYTGLTRESWIDAAKYIVNGVFKHIKHFEDPVIVPRLETKITYPHVNAPDAVLAIEKQAEVFEGLTRTFFVAAPLIENESDFCVNGYRLADYYKSHVLRCCTKGDSLYVGDYSFLQKATGNTNPFRAFQQTVETCALVICLEVSRRQIWEQYTKSEKDTIAAFLSDFAKASTVPQNWRLFNMLDMAFLHKEGYPIDVDIMRDHAQAILNYYVGDGWYRDGQSFDYYSCWAFNVYAPLWNSWYGYENEKDIAARFETASNALMKTYPDFFDSDGFTNMWGRSCVYRFAATSAFDGNFFLRNPTIDPGLARRISSGSLLQFLGRDDTLIDGVPSMGFYRQFAPLVQGYSCAESPFWFGKAFLCLHLPKNHPFWTAKENNGSWESLGDLCVKETVLDGPALCFTNHGGNGETVLRTGKVVKASDDLHGMWNYSKLCFNSKYPWESTPKLQTDVESEQYVLKDITSGKNSLANVTLWHGSKNGVLYRRQFFDYNLQNETHWIQALNLADFPVAHGIMRVDKHRLFRRPVSLTLGSYGFPDNGTEIIQKTCGSARAIVLKGHDRMGREKQLAMTIFDGWKKLDVLHSEGTNPDSAKSIVVYAWTSFLKQYSAAEPYVMISQVITRESLEDFSEEELFPIASVTYTDSARTGSYGDVIITMKDGTQRCVNFEGIESCLKM